MPKFTMQEKSDPILKEKYEREAREHEEAESAAVQRRADLAAWAATVVEDPPPVRVLKMFERREGVDVLFTAVALALEKAEADLAALEAERATRLEGRGTSDVYLLGQYREKLQPLHAAVAEARERYAICREVATIRVTASLDKLIDMQVPQVVDHLRKAQAPDDRIRTFEEAFSHFSIPRFGSKSFGIARLLRTRATQEDKTLE